MAENVSVWEEEYWMGCGRTPGLGLPSLSMGDLNLLLDKMKDITVPIKLCLNHCLVEIDDFEVFLDAIPSSLILVYLYFADICLVGKRQKPSVSEKYSTIVTRTLQRFPSIVNLDFNVDFEYLSPIVRAGKHIRTWNFNYMCTRVFVQELLKLSKEELSEYKFKLLHLEDESNMGIRFYKPILEEFFKALHSVPSFKGLSLYNFYLNEEELLAIFRIPSLKMLSLNGSCVNLDCFRIYHPFSTDKLIETFSESNLEEFNIDAVRQVEWWSDILIRILQNGNKQLKEIYVNCNPVGDFFTAKLDNVPFRTMIPEYKREYGYAYERLDVERRLADAKKKRILFIMLVGQKRPGVLASMPRDAIRKLADYVDSHMIDSRIL